MEWDDEATPRGLDLPRLFAAVSAHKRWIVLPTLAAFLCALAFVTLVKPRYAATAKVMLENGDSYFTRPDKAIPESASRRHRRNDGGERSRSRQVAGRRASGDGQAEAGGSRRIFGRRPVCKICRPQRQSRGSPAGGFRQAGRDLSAGQDPGAAVRVLLSRSRARGARRERAGRGVPPIAAAGQGRRGEVGGQMALRADRRAARQGRGRRDPRRGACAPNPAFCRARAALRCLRSNCRRSPRRSPPLARLRRRRPRRLRP